MTKQEKKAVMFGMVEQWQESGMSQAAFAQSQNITLVKFRYWIQKHRHSQGSADFIQLGGFPSSCGISIRYPNGVELTLPAQTPASAIKSLINY
ncbi:MAG TPA: hypothetical protein PLR34_09395 [Bacteroidales bacterium]|jgi:hypothetical protein|nr:hypothetical protein [Candidatus Moranbacteria bacterium]HQM99354.1 hypothetical protein [Bacteroidales bacterium]